jgi:hypothetical protein
MKLQLSHSKTEKNYESNKYILNLNTNIYNQRKTKYSLKRKNLEIKSLSNFDEEYIQRLKYRLSEITSTKKNKNSVINSKFPSISKNSQTFNFSRQRARRKSTILIKNLKEEKKTGTKYENKLENIYKENFLEKKRAEIELKISKIKSLMKPLSMELANTLKKIENYKLDLEIINNFNFSENNFRKIYLSQLKSNSNSIKSDFTNHSSSLNSSNTDKIKSKELDLYIKREKAKLNNKKLIAMEKLSKFNIKRDSILSKYNSCETELHDLKKELNKIKDKLILHYHKLLFEAKDTRSEGLSWIIRALWKLKTNVLLSYLPKFLDKKSIEFLFKYSDKLVEIEQIQKKIQEKKDYLKNFGKQIERLSIKLLKDDMKENNNYNNNDNEKKEENSDIIYPKRKKRLKTHRPPSQLILKNMRRKKILMTESPIKALERLLSQSPKKSDKNEKEKTSSDFDDETFKTSLYDTKKSLININSNFDKMKPKNNKIIQNLEMMLENPNYLDQLTNHLSPKNNLKIVDYENMNNYKIEDIYDSNLVKIFNEHKNLLIKLKEKKVEAEKFVKNELDRIGKCFYIEDYSGKYNTDLKTVVCALIGEDNSKLEVFRLQKEQKEYFRTIKNLRTFNLLNRKIC